jgi:mRNA interferase MazF
LLAKKARILLDQLCTIDNRRLGKKMGAIDIPRWHDTLLEMLA